MRVTAIQCLDYVRCMLLLLICVQYELLTDIIYLLTQLGRGYLQVTECSRNREIERQKQTETQQRERDGCGEFSEARQPKQISQKVKVPILSIYQSNIRDTQSRGFSECLDGLVGFVREYQCDPCRAMSLQHSLRQDSFYERF